MHFAPIAVLIAYWSLLVAGKEKRVAAARRGLPRFSRSDWAVKPAGGGPLSARHPDWHLSSTVRASSLDILSVAPGAKGIPLTRHNIASVPMFSS
jgi:hypothetical protein